MDGEGGSVGVAREQRAALLEEGTSSSLTASHTTGRGAGVEREGGREGVGVTGVRRRQACYYKHGV